MDTNHASTTEDILYAWLLDLEGEEEEEDAEMEEEEDIWNAAAFIVGGAAEVQAR